MPDDPCARPHPELGWRCQTPKGHDGDHYAQAPGDPSRDAWRTEGGAVSDDSTLYVMPPDEDGRITIPEGGWWTLSWRGGSGVVFGEYHGEREPTDWAKEGRSE